MCIWMGNEVAWVDTVLPEEMIIIVRWFLKTYHVSRLVIEKFTLYPDKAMEQTGSEMETSQHIGALKVLAWEGLIPVVLQPAAIKTPTWSLLNHRGIELESVKRKKNNHAQDAEIHGRHWLIEGRKRYPDIRGSDLF